MTELRIPHFCARSRAEGHGERLQLRRPRTGSLGRRERERGATALLAACTPHDTARSRSRSRLLRRIASTCGSRRGLETISIRMPAVVTTDLRLNEPRYVTLPHNHEGEEEAAGDS